MYPFLKAWALVASLTVTSATSLDFQCNVAYAKAALPTIPAITIDSSSLTTSAHTNYSVPSGVMYPAASGLSYCNVTFAYSHNGRNDRVLVTYWLPSSDSFKNRFLSTGGGGLAINSGANSVAGGISHGAAAGLTDGGFGGFSTNVDVPFLLANGTVNWDIVHLFGYEAIHEMTLIGHAFTKNYFNTTKLYRYYQGCSEGGREGWSQVQRYRDQFDGAVLGAPAFRYGQQQVNHLTSNVVEKTLDYYPPPCELEKIVNLTIAACDSLDGLTDGVIARTDLCKLHLNTSSFIGQPYYCAASKGGGMGPIPGSTAQTVPDQNGTVSAKGVEVADTIVAGLKDTKGRQAYLSYALGASFADAQTTYNNATQSWDVSLSGLGGEWVERFLLLQNSSTLPSLDNVTYDTLRDWMNYGMQRYYDTLQTTWPDLTEYQSSGGKVIHYHGDADNSIPTASSVRYFESVREIMYGDLSYNESVAALSEWYKLFLIPGAAHCGTNTAMPNGPWPQTQLDTMIQWVENGVEPKTLPAQYLTGTYKGQSTEICAWPLRPLYNGSATAPQCVYDEESLDTWKYDLNAYKFPVY